MSYNQQYYNQEYVDGLKKLHHAHVSAVERMWLGHLLFAIVAAISLGISVGILFLSLLLSVPMTQQQSSQGVAPQSESANGQRDANERQ